jgi:DNA (cytosine-5)-methyltransferase 1
MMEQFSSAENGGHKTWRGVPADEPVPAILALRPTDYAIVGDIPEPEPSAKPPYRVLGRAETAAIPSNGYSLVSTFSGAGGSSTGFRMAGFRPVYASEFVKAAAECYRANWPETPIDPRDIRDVTADDIRRIAGIETVDVLEGSPPCSSFSVSGKRQRGWGEIRHYSEERSQRTDDLFGEYVRLLYGLRPRVFIAENVAGMTTGKALGFYLRYRDEMSAAGYVVEARVLDAQWLGVPQRRRRLIYLGIRQDEYDRGMRHIWPTPLPYRYSIADAIGGMSTEVRSFVTGRETVPETVAPSIEGSALDGEYDAALNGTARYTNLTRNTFRTPSGTVSAIGGSSAGIASVVHPTERRKFSIAELKALSGFPPDYILPGTFSQQWERVGRSVPPVMMAAIARCIAQMLDGGA